MTIVSPLRWTARHIWRHQTGRLVLIGLIAVAGAGLAAIVPTATRHVLDGVTLGAVPLLWLAVLLTALTVPAVLDTLQKLIQAPLARAMIAAGDHLVIELGAAMPDLGVLDDRTAREEIWKSSAGIDRAVKIHEHLLVALSALVGSAVLLVGVAQLSWYVPLLLLLPAIPNTIVHARSQSLRYASDLRQTPLQQEAWYCLWAGSFQPTAREIRVFGMGDWLVDRHDRYALQAGRDQLRTTTHTTLLTAAVAVLYSVLIAAVMWLGAATAPSAGQLALLITSTIALSGSVDWIASSLTNAFNGLRAAQRLMELQRLAQPTIAIAPDGHPAPQRWRDGLTLVDVTFGYDPERPVLDHLNLRIPAGKVMALVGENGEGKSTLVRLLTRMNDPQGGTITLDGRPLDAYDVRSYRRGIATVFQDHARLNMSVLENVAIGDQRLIESPDDPELARRALRALQDGGAAFALAKYPEGLSAGLGSQYGGYEPSGGEWQRLATARAFYPDADFVILDEPTSALDADAERRLFDTFRQLMHGRTALLISHRFSTVRQADLIAVLGDGRITEIGTHDELMALRGSYCDMFTVQAQRYE